MPFATLVMRYQSEGATQVKSDMAGIRQEGAATEAGVKKSMAGVSSATASVPKATKAAEAGFNSLRMSLDPLYAQSRQYEAAVRQVDAAVSAGVASQAQANRVLDLASQRYLGLANGANTAADAAANVNARMSGGAFGLRNFGLQLGQVAQQGQVTGDYLGALAIQSGDMLLGFGALGIALSVVASVMAPFALDMLKGSEAAASLNFNVTALQPVLSGIATVMAPVGQAIGTTFTALAENLDRVVIIAGTAATLFAGRYVAGVVAARVATLSFSASLVVLRGALIRTGIGALIVGAGELVFQFTRLVQAAGGFGAAMGQLGNVASAVWQGIVDSAQAIPPALNGVWNSIKSGFLTMVADLTWAWRTFLQSISDSADSLSELEVLGIRPFEGMADGILEAANKAAAASNDILESANSARGAASDAFAEAATTISTAFDPARAAVGALAETVATAEAETVSFGGALDDTGGSAKGAGRAVKAAAADVKALNDEISRLEDAADPARKFRREMEELDRLLDHGLSDGAYAYAVRELNDELVNSTPILSDVNDAFGQMVDYMFDGFKDGMKGIWDIFRNTLRDMIAAAARSQITFSLGAAVGGAGSATTAAAPGTGTGGILSNTGLLNGIWGTSSAPGLLGGTGLLGAGGGSGFLGLGAGSGLAGALGGGAFGAAASVALPVLGVAALAASFFKKTKEIVANGVAIQFDGALATLSTFEKSKEVSGFGTISSGFDREFDRMDQAVQDALNARIDLALGELERFGFNTDLSGFTFANRTEIKDGETLEGETTEQINAVIRAAIEEITAGAIAAYQMSGETLEGTLTRLSTSLDATNEALYLFDQNLLPISLEGAAAAAALLEISGGLEAFNQKAGFVFTNLLTEAEQAARMEAIAKDNLAAVTEELKQFNIVIPETHAGFVELLDAQDLTTESGRQTYTALLNVAESFVEVNGTAQEAADELNNDLTPAINNTGDAADSTASRLRDLQDGLRAAGQEIADTLRAAESAYDGAVNVIRDIVSAARDAVSDAEDALRRAFDAVADDINRRYDDQIAAAETVRDNLQDAADATGAALDAARALLTNAEGLLNRSFGAAMDDLRSGAEALAEQTRREAEDKIALWQDEITAIRERTDIQIEGAAAAENAAREQVQAARAISDLLDDALNTRRALTQAEERMRLTSAEAFLRNAVASGGTTDQEGLQRALDAVADPSTALFSSFEEYQASFNVNTNLIKQLSETSSRGVLSQERSLRDLNGRSEDIRDAADTQIAALEALIAQEQEALEDQLGAQEANLNTELDKLQDLLDATLGVDTSIVGIQEAIAGYEAAQIAFADAFAADEEAQRAILEQGFDAQVEAINAARDAELASLNDQLNAILGVDTSILSLGDAISNYQTAIVDLNAAVTALGQFVEQSAQVSLDQAVADAQAAQDAVDQAQADQVVNTLLQSLATIDGAIDAAAIGAGAIGQISEDQTNAILTTAGVDALTGIASDVATMYQNVLGREVDIEGLKFYSGLVQADMLTLSGVMDDLSQSTEAVTGIIPGFAIAVENTQVASLVAQDAASVAVDAANSAAASAAQAAQFVAKPTRPQDFVGDLYGNYGVPFSQSGYEFWNGVYDERGASYTRSEFVAAAMRDGTAYSVPAYASGTTFHPGGLAYVHKDELLDLPRGTQVTPANPTRQMLLHEMMTPPPVSRSVTSSASGVKQAVEERKKTNALLRENNDRMRELQIELNRQGRLQRQQYREAQDA